MTTQKRVLEILHKYGGYWILLEEIIGISLDIIYKIKKAKGIEPDPRFSGDGYYYLLYFAYEFILLFAIWGTGIWIALSIASIILYGRQFKINYVTIIVFLSSITLFYILSKSGFHEPIK